MLACLPTASTSPRPPPALLPLLTPILRQRVQLLSASASNKASWLPLLCWDREIAAKLPQVVENMQVEPHPVSGEIEIEDVEKIEYRRLDAETLQCRLHLDDFELLPCYLWCIGDTPGWKLSELRTSADKSDGSQWHESLQETTEVAGVQDPPSRNDSLMGQSNGAKGHGDPKEPGKSTAQNDNDEDDDSAYWAAYDRTPGRTPAKTSPAPASKPGSSVQIPTANELEYFARYMAEVQPAMDPHDPSEDALKAGESTLTGNTFHTNPTAAPRQPEPEATSEAAPVDTDRPVMPLTNGNLDRKDAEDDGIVHPRPSSSSSMSGSVARLERQASVANAAEIGIKQHISTDIKSLFRLAKSAGIDRVEFERLVRTELEVLSMMDME